LYGPTLEELLPLIVGLSVVFSVYGRLAEGSDPATVASDSFSGPPSMTLRRVVVLQDVSESIRRTGSPRLSTAEIASLFDALRSADGGFELSVGLIEGNSGRAFHRVFVLPPPVAPQSPTAMNPFERRDAMKKFAEAHGAWKRDTEARKTAFLSQVDALLDAPEAKATDVSGALQATSVLFNEDVAFGRTSSSYLVAVSDLQDTVGRRFGGLSPNIKVFVVNKFGHTGILAGIAPKVVFDFNVILQLAGTWR
jgi:hypothetical protein